MKPKRNVARLAKQLAKQDGSNKEAVTQSIWRALNTKTAYGKKVQKYLREDLFERGITVRTKHNGNWIDVFRRGRGLVSSCIP